MSENMKTEDASLVVARWRNTERRMYPEVAAYLSAYRQVEWDYEDARYEASQVANRAESLARRAAEIEGRVFDTYSNSADAAKRDEWYQAQRAANDAARVAHDAARTTMRAALTASPHKEVAWIAEHCLFANEGEEVEGYARDILAILPATTEEIWEEAKDNRGMCEVFDRFYNSAENAGIFHDGPLPAGAREMQAVRNYIRRNYGSSYMRDLSSQIDRVAKAIRDDYDTRLEAAKAEWQGLDEAWRSERSRRGAATRAANRDVVTEARQGAMDDMAGEIIRSTFTDESVTPKVEEFEHVDSF